MKYLVLLSTVTISTISVCSDRPTIHSLIKASDHELRSMSPVSLDATKQRLEAYVKETERNFANEPIFFGFSRRMACNSLGSLGLLSMASSALYHYNYFSLIKHYDSLSEICPATAPDAFRLTAEDHMIREHERRMNGTMIRHHLAVGSIAFVCAFALGAAADYISKHPAQRQLDKIAAIEKQRR